MAALSNSTWFKVQQEERRFLVHIIMTERCNLKCAYCYQKKGREGGDLDVERALETLFAIIDGIDPSTDTSIRFFGGEPLLEFEKIKQLTKVARTYWLKTARDPAKLVFGITTNGTLLNEDIRNWLLENPDVSLAVSLDGTPEMHNANRSDSYALIEPHLEFLKRYRVPVKMTIGPASIRRCAEGIMFLDNLGFSCQANLVFEDVWGGEASRHAYLQSFGRELDNLVRYYSDNPVIPRTTLLIPLEASLPLPENYHFLESYLCGIGKNMATIGTDGKQYTCERAIPFSRDGSEAFFDLSRKKLKPETCAACPLLPLCPECRAYNFEHYGDANHKTTYRCEFLQLQLRASALLLFNDVCRIKKTGEMLSLGEEEIALLQRQIDTALFIEQFTRPLHDRLFGR